MTDVKSDVMRLSPSPRLSKMSYEAKTEKIINKLIFQTYLPCVFFQYHLRLKQVLYYFIINVT
jgi:hypothetical protein